MKNQFYCPACGSPRLKRGPCSTCGVRLCGGCKAPLPVGRASRYCSECRRVREKKWNEANPEKVLEIKRKWREENREQHRQCCRKWLEANTARAKEAVSRWQDQNWDRVLAAGRKWSATHPEKIREKCRRRRARKKGCVVSSADIAVVVERSGGRCAACNALVPEEFRHIDHIVPLAKGGPHSTENLQLLCYRCNTRKGTRLPDEFTPDRWVKKPNPEQPFLLNPDWK